MNDQEKALHIGEVWQAWRENNECIQYQHGCHLHTGVDLVKNHRTLVDHPERYSIKKELQSRSRIFDKKRT